MRQNHLLSPFIPLLLGAGMLNLGLGLQGSLLSLRAEVEGFPLPVIGAIMAAYYGGFIYGSVSIPSIVDRIGHIRTFAVMASLASAMVLLHALVVTPLAWGVFRAATGFCLVGMSLVVESWLNQASNPQQRGTLLATYMMVILGSTALSQWFLILAPTSGFTLFITVSVVLSLSLVPIVISTRPTPVVAPRERMLLSLLARRSPVGVVGALTSGVLAGAFWSLGVVYAKGIGLDRDAIALYMFCLLGGGLLFTWPVGRLSDYMDRRFIILGLGGVVLLLSILMHLPSVTPGALFYLLTILFGGAVLPLYAISVALVNDHLKEGEFLSAASTLLLLYGAGAVLGPLVGSTLMAWLGPVGLFTLSGGVVAMVALFILYRLTKRAPLPATEIQVFIPVPRTTSAAYAMDPRAKKVPVENPSD